MWQTWMFNVRHWLHSFYQREKNKVEISRTFSCPCLSVLVLIQKNSFKSHMLLSKWDIKQKNLGSFFNVKSLSSLSSFFPAFFLSSVFLKVGPICKTSFWPPSIVYISIVNYSVLFEDHRTFDMYLFHTYGYFQLHL